MTDRPRAIAEAIVCAMAYSDQQSAELLHCAKVFQKAHESAPGGFSLEIGTRCGGSAVLFLKLIEVLYAAEARPMLLTVDPYGLKPYLERPGDVDDVWRPYADVHYLQAKKVLAPYPNHAHFLMESGAFLRQLAGLEIWERGVKRTVHGAITFAFLDGNHDTGTVTDELERLWSGWMNPKGTVLIDNVDKDPGLLPALEKTWTIDSLHVNPTSGVTQAVVKR